MKCKRTVVWLSLDIKPHLKDYIMSITIMLIFFLLLPILLIFIPPYPTSGCRGFSLPMGLFMLCTAETKVYNYEISKVPAFTAHTSRQENVKMWGFKGTAFVRPAETATSSDSRRLWAHDRVLKCSLHWLQKSWVTQSAVVFFFCFLFFVEAAQL